jgi:PAS domain-containing protein
MEDLYPSPLAGIFVCDQQGRVLALGRGALALAGFDEDELIGIDLEDALELRMVGDLGAENKPPHLTALEWGVRVLGKTMTIRVADGTVTPVTGDFFPAYDDDGGLLAVFTPRSV